MQEFDRQVPLMDEIDAKVGEFVLWVVTLVLEIPGATDFI